MLKSEWMWESSEHEEVIDHESPLGTLTSAIGGIEQGGDRVEEHYNDDS